MTLDHQSVSGGLPTRSLMGAIAKAKGISGLRDDRAHMNTLDTPAGAVGPRLDIMSHPCCQEQALHPRERGERGFLRPTSLPSEPGKHYLLVS